eukprot:CAMPEP_0174287820 /NCGR_PEP_ID=MMETSP0809-20121228/17795_1 /TAXON_ID=73025 ORGANISM="Eutreptiella gymnastica-like, Strain CCMP1594" /NCGR_SAMPLE_ID=MMETSP0809 /ASSEMBLY_ACC=CAM_ASM_000658 /LENGTH=31 /DNA_ID= /DNA_START= /DNA_END= /DNA_ORIENTATION=
MARVVSHRGTWYRMGPLCGALSAVGAAGWNP